MAGEITPETIPTTVEACQSLATAGECGCLTYACMLQPIEAAVNICCGGYTALVGQFKEAGSPLFQAPAI